MGSEEQTITVADLSASNQMIKFCLNNNIHKTVIDERLDRSFDSIPALSLLEQEDLKSLKIPVGQRSLILHITKSLKNDDTVKMVPQKPLLLPQMQGLQILGPQVHSQWAMTALPNNLQYTNNLICTSTPSLTACWHNKRNWPRHRG